MAKIQKEQYSQIMKVFREGNVDKLTSLQRAIPDFSSGRDDFIGRHWIVNAVSVGTPEVVKWFLENSRCLNFRDEEGYTLLHVAIDRADEDKYAIIESLIRYGAALNLKGINDWTPLHLAAARNDARSVEMLLLAGADPSIRTTIDGCWTPEEEAELLGSADAISVFKQHSRNS